MRYGLSDSVLERITDVLRTIPHIQRAILYGSRARGDYRPSSDIDLTLEGNELTHSDLLCLYNRLDDLSLPYRFDLSILSQLTNPALLVNIHTDGQLITPDNHV